MTDRADPTDASADAATDDASNAAAGEEPLEAVQATPGREQPGAGQPGAAHGSVTPTSTDEGDGATVTAHQGDVERRTEPNGS